MRRFLAGLLAAFIAVPAMAQMVTAPAFKTTGGQPQSSTGVICLNLDGTSCTFGGGGGGGGASYTAASSPFAVTAGTNKPAGIDTASSAQFVELCKPGTTQCLDPFTSSGVFGVDGASIATAANPFPTSINGTVPLPTGAATSALQTTGNTSLGTIATNTTNLTVAQGSTTSGQNGQLMQGAVTSATPAYTTAQTSPLSLFTNGELRIGGGVADGATDSGDPVKTGCVFLSATPTYTNTQRTTCQVNAKGAVFMNLEDSTGSALTFQTPNDARSTATPSLPTVGYGYSYNGTTWDRNRSLTGSFGAQIGVPAVAQIGGGGSNITTATNTQVKTGAGTWRVLSWNTLVGSSTLKCYDGTSTAGTVLGTWTLPTTVTAIAPFSMQLGRSFATGLFCVTTGTSDITLIVD